MLNQLSRERNGSVLQMIETLEICSTALKNDEASRLLEMAVKALAQLQTHNDTVTTEAMNWKLKYEQHVEKSGDLAEKNGQLLIKCQQLEVDLVDERRLNDMHLEKIDDLADKNEKLDCELIFCKAQFEASPMDDTATAVSNSSSFGCDVYGQLYQFEHSFEQAFDMEVEDFEQLGFLESSPDVSMTSSGENVEKSIAMNSEDGETSDNGSEQAPSSCQEILVGDKPLEIGIVTPLQDKTLEAIKDTLGDPNRHPLQLIHRIFRTQTKHMYDALPAMTTSNTFVSLSSDDSVSTTSSSDLLCLTPTKKTIKMSPQPNAEWATIE